MKTIITSMLLLCIIAVTAQDKIYVHTATTANSSLNGTYIDHPDLNGNPNAPIVYTHVYNPGGTAGVYNDNATGLWYDGAQWLIYNEDFSVPIVEGSSYNIFIASDSVVSIHVSNSGNQGSFGAYTTVIDDSFFNGNDPGPYSVFSTYFNPSDVYNDHNYGYYYDVALDKRGIYNEAATSIPEDAAFRILRFSSGSSSVAEHEATAGNTSNNYTIIDDPLLNGNPNATFVAIHYWGSLGAGSNVVIDAVLGLWYTGTHWSIYTEDISAMPEGLAFDLIIADADPLGTDDFELDAEISMYPNPTEDFVTISAEDTIDSIEIYNTLGQEVLQIKGESDSINADISALNTGNYFVKVRVANALKTLKLVKQ